MSSLQREEFHDAISEIWSDLRNDAIKRVESATKTKDKKIVESSIKAAAKFLAFGELIDVGESMVDMFENPTASKDIDVKNLIPHISGSGEGGFLN